MAKWHGVLGFVDTEESDQEVHPGVWEPNVSEFEYFGDVLRSKRSYRDAEKLVDDIFVSNQISVLADPYAMSHLGTLRYISYAGSLWEIASVETVFPRLNIELGGLYHGETPNRASSDSG